MKPLKLALRIAALMTGCLALAGCLMTERPVFGPGTAIRADRSAEFAEFTAVFEAFSGESLSEGDLTPADLWLVERDNYMIVQNHAAGDPEAWYFVIGHAGGRPFLCHVDPDEQTDAQAASLGVSVTLRRHYGWTDPEDAGPIDRPVEEGGTGHRVYHGTDEALRAFVLDQFTNRRLDCEFAAPDD